MEAFEGLSKSNRLPVNPNKFKFYCGNVDNQTKQEIQLLTNFSEGPLPFKHLGISLMSKKLFVFHYLGLVKKIVVRVKHWSAILLIFTGRIQFIKSILFVIANYWMQCIHFLKQVCNKIEAICRSFLWSGKKVITKKSHVAWNKVFSHISQGGLNIISIKVQNKACLIKLLQNLCRKIDSLWIKWVYCYYIKNTNILLVPIKTTCSWILKAIIKQRDFMHQQIQQQVAQDNKFRTKLVYHSLIETQPLVQWRNLLFNNVARPRACFTLWLANHNILAMKDRLHRFVMIHNEWCEFCDQREIIQDLLFDYDATKSIWQHILNWIHIQRSPKGWIKELTWIISACKGKDSKVIILKVVFT